MRKKKRYTIDELNAYKVAYGRPLAKEDYFFSIVLPGLFGGGLTFLLLNNWWVMVPVVFMYAFYGYRVLFPLNIQRFYLHKAYEQRNRFLNNLTQLLSDQTLSWFVALQRASERCEGEFRSDLDDLLVRLHDASEVQRHQFFKQFMTKYAHDVIFYLYMEQIETIACEGRTNIDMLRDIKTYHNQLRKRTKGFIERKKKLLAQVQVGVLLSSLFIGVLHVVPLGIDGYVTHFAYTPVGWITSGLYLVVLSFQLHQVLKSFYDDEIMEVTG